MLDKRFYRTHSDRPGGGDVSPLQVNTSVIPELFAFLDRLDSIDLLAGDWSEILSCLLPLVRASGCAILSNDPTHTCPSLVAQCGTWHEEGLAELLADATCRTLVGSIERPTRFVLDARRRIPRLTRHAAASALAAPGVFHAQRCTTVLFTLDAPRTVPDTDLGFLRLVAHCLALRAELKATRDSLMREMDRVSRMESDIDRLCSLVRRQQET